MAVAGIAAGVVALPWNWLRLGYFALDPGVMAGLFITRVVAGALAGLGAKAIGDLVAATGSLNYFAPGRERVQEVGPPSSRAPRRSPSVTSDANAPRSATSIPTGT